MGSEKGKWNTAEDGSRMKVTEGEEQIKTERISSEDRPHDHEITKVDKPSGTVKEIYVGENADRSRDRSD